jgi:hypothetical protein
MSALAGHPETTIQSVIASALYIILRLLQYRGAGSIPGASPLLRGLRLVALFAGSCFVGFLIAGVQFLPMFEYVLNGEIFRARRGMEHGWISAHWLFSNWDYARNEMLSYVSPHTWGNPSVHNHWWNPYSNFNESAGYAGAGILLLSVVAWRYFFQDKRIRLFCILQALSFVYILDITPATIDFNAFPGMNILANKRFLFLFCFSNAVLAAILIDRFNRWGGIDAGGAVMLCAVAVGMPAWAGYDYYELFYESTREWVCALGKEQLVHLAVAVLPWLVLCFIGRMRYAWRAFVFAGLICIAAADLFIVHYGYNPFIDPEDMYPQVEALSFLNS